MSVINTDCKLTVGNGMHHIFIFLLFLKARLHACCVVSLEFYVSSMATLGWSWEEALAAPIMSHA